MPKKIFFIILLLCLALLSLKAEVSFAGQKSLAAINRHILKEKVVNSYLKGIPQKFKKYIHFSRFSFTVPVKNVNIYFMNPVIVNPGFSGYHTIIIKLSDKNSGALKQIAYVSFKTAIYAPVAVASRTIGKMQIIKPGDVKISYKNISGLNEGYYLKSEGPIGREAKFFIVSGSALTGANTEKKRIINFGNSVNVVYKSSGLILKTKGIALQSGALNSVIRVKNIDSGIILNCTVKSNKIVTVR